MRAVRCCEGKIQLVDVAPSREGDVRVRVRAAGICGSDLHMIRAGFPMPHTIGHEFAGELDDGSAVAVEPLLPCGSCEYCQEKRFNLCRVGPSMLMGIQRDGGMTDEVWVPDRCITPLPKGVSVRHGSLIEPLAVALHGIHKAGIQAGQRVAVVGAGTIGLCAAIAAQSVGAEVDLIARHDHQRQAGEALGARLEAKGEYSVVIDCAGNSEALAQAAGLCLPGGVLLLLATYWQGMEMPGFAICLKEITCIPASLYSHERNESDFQTAVAILAERAEIPEVMITHRFDLDAAPEAFEVAADRKAGAIKVVLET